MHIPEQTVRLSSNEVNAILVCPVVDLKLLAQRDTCENNSLDTSQHSFDT